MKNQRFILAVICLLLANLMLTPSLDMLHANTTDTRSSRPANLVDILNISRTRTLFAKAEMLRFLDIDGNTEFHINFKIPNNELQFILESGVYIATLEIELNLFYQGELVSPTKYTQRVGANTLGIAQSANHYFLEKIDMTLAVPGFTATLEITDKNASTFFSQDFILPLLDPNSLVGDIEISNGISTNLTPALQNFQRGSYQFYVDPIPVLQNSEKDFIMFHIVSNITPDEEGFFNFTESIKVKNNDNLVWTFEDSYFSSFMPYPLIKRIPIGNYEPGLYTLEITITCPQAQRTETTQRNFSLTQEYIFMTQRVFADDTDEFDLLCYFLDTRQRRLWRDLNEEGRKGFIDRFWTSNNPNPASDTNLFLEAVRLRVNEANWRFSAHRAGWKSDMGRIFIKWGSPNDIEKRVTSPDARYSRKDYQIWRYNVSGRAYIFLDFQGNGNYRLIHAKNDDFESVDPAWRAYLGTDFDNVNF
jgi:GWxTD domain-containing protein